MIAISKMTVDTDAALVINEADDSTLYDGSARVSRSATLDGGVVIDHSGFTEGDRTLSINCMLTEAEDAILKSLFENETFVYISTKDGFYQGAISNLRGDNGNRQITILIKEAA